MLVPPSEYGVPLSERSGVLSAEGPSPSEYGVAVDEEEATAASSSDSVDRRRRRAEDATTPLRLPVLCDAAGREDELDLGVVAAIGEADRRAEARGLALELLLLLALGVVVRERCTAGVGRSTSCDSASTGETTPSLPSRACSHLCNCRSWSKRRVHSSRSSSSDMLARSASPGQHEEVGNLARMLTAKVLLH